MLVMAVINKAEEADVKEEEIYGEMWEWIQHSYVNALSPPSAAIQALSLCNQ